MAVKNQSSINPDLPVKIDSSEHALLEWVDQFISQRAAAANPPSYRSELCIYGNDYSKYLHASDPITDGPMPGAICLTQPFTGSYLELYSVGIRHIIYRAYPLAYESLELALSALQSSPPNRTENCSESQSDLLRRVQTLSDINETLTCAEQLVSSIGFEEARSKAIWLCLKEAVTNAVFHGFRKSGSHDRKYTPETFRQMEDNDDVTLCLRITDNWLIATIADNSGSLGPLSVVNSLDRHHSNLGLLDERGRGFYLMHHLAQRMVVSIARQERTRIELHFAIRETNPGINHLQLLVF